MLPDLMLSNLTPGPAQWRLALGVVLVLLIGFALAAYHCRYFGLVGFSFEKPPVG